MYFGFMAEIGHNFLLPFKNSYIYVRPTVIQSCIRCFLHSALWIAENQKTEKYMAEFLKCQKKL